MSDTKISEACERCGRCRQGDFANCKNARNLEEASRDALPFVAYAYSQGIEGAEEAGRAVESALEAAPLHPQPAELAGQQGYDDGTGRIRDWSGEQQVGDNRTSVDSGALKDALDAVVEAICYDEHGIQVANVSSVVRERIGSALAATGKQQVGDIDPRAALGWEKARAALQVGEVQGDALLPCPFCGESAERIDFGAGAGDNEGGSCVACTGCGSSGPVEFGFKENFRSTWNRRALSATGKQQVGEDCTAILAARIALEVELCGSLQRVAKELSIDVGYLSRLARGEKTNPSDEVLEKLGLERTVTYTPIKREYVASPLHPRTKSA